MKKWAAGFLVLLVFLLSGCQPISDRRDISSQRVISIRLKFDTPTGILHRYYTAPEEVHALLHILRRQDLKGTGESQQKLALMMNCADGTTRRSYRLGILDSLQDFILSTPGNTEVPLFVDVCPLPRRAYHRVYFPALRNFPAPYK